jgi:hypothetical protein
LPKCSFGQKLDLKQSSTSISIKKRKKDTINFILIDTKLDEIKPIFILSRFIANAIVQSNQQKVFG